MYLIDYLQFLALCEEKSDVLRMSNGDGVIMGNYRLVLIYMYL